MSSAAKLRRFGKGTAAVAVAATVMTAFGPAAFASWDDDPNTPLTQEGWPATAFVDQGNYGTIGIVDTGVPKVALDGTPGDPGAAGVSLDPTPASQALETADENQGAKLVWAGKTGQSIADVRITLPNRFTSGDIVDLVLTDRSSTETTNGNTNADAGRAVGFSASPTVSVDSEPKIGNKGGLGWAIDSGTVNAPAAGADDTLYPAGTQVSPDSDAVTEPPTSLVKVSNTETGAAAWVAHRESAAAGGDSPATAAVKLRQRTKPTSAPEFNVELAADAGAQGKNRIRLVAKNAAGGDPDAMWVVTLKDLKVDLGANVTPGALRITPFATSFLGANNSAPSPWFANNHKENVGSLIPVGGRGASGNQREIGIYTVPAYVSPVTITAENLSIISDMSPQALGDVTLTETAPYSLGNGDYALDIDGAISTSTNLSSLKVTVKNGGTTETATVKSITNDTTSDGVTIVFTIANTDLTKTASYVVSGLNVRTTTTTPRSLTVSLSGGTINGPAYEGGAYWLTPAGLSTLAIAATPSYAAVQPDSWFVGELGATESNRVAPATATPATTTYTIDWGAVTGLNGVTPDPQATLTVNPGAGTLTATIARNGTGNVTAVTITGVPGAPITATNVGGATGGAGTATFALGGVTFTVAYPASAITGANQTGTAAYTSTAQTTGTGTITTPSTNVDDSVNQLDIMADGPIESLLLKGSAAAGANTVGGNNRYETARKIAKLYSPSGDYAIIASGENYPDALSSGYLSQRAGAPINLTMKNSVPQDTLESLRERHVKKVFIVGGTSAVSSGVEKQLAATPSYYWDAAALASKPRGSNLEVVRLGGTSRYSTNQLVNMYAAAQFDTQSTVGRTATEYGKALRTTAMIARGDAFADALTANVLTAGRNGGFVLGSPLTLQNGASAPGGYVLTGGLGNLTQTGTYTILLESVGTANAYFALRNPAGVVIARTATFDDTDAAGNANAGTSAFVYAANGTTTLTTPITVSSPLLATGAGSGFTTQSLSITYTPAAVGTGDPVVVKGNALPVILTEKGSLNEAAKAQMKNLYIEHALVIGGADVIPDSVVKQVDALNVSTRRLGGKDRYETAKLVNEYAMAPVSIAAAGGMGGLGFEGGKNGTNNQMFTAYLANGLNYPDALVAGPWVSANRDAMALVWQGSIPDVTKAFLTDQAEKLDNATGLGLGSAVALSVVQEANRIVASK